MAEMSKSSQIPQVKHENTSEGAHCEDAPRTMAAALTGQPVWPGMVQSPLQVGMNIPFQAVTTSNLANVSICDLDQPPISDEGVRRDDVRKTTNASLTDQPVWSGMVPIPPQLRMNIPLQAVTVPDLGKSSVWSGVGASPVTNRDYTTESQYVTTSNPASLSIPDLDQPLIIDLSADRFNRTSEAVKAESSPGEQTTKIIGHYTIH